MENAWEGVFDGSGEVNKCIQPAADAGWTFTDGSEDCLQLSVYGMMTDVEFHNMASEIQ